MHRKISVLIEIWYEIVKKINSVIFSFIFFWSMADYLPFISKITTRYLNHLANKTGNPAYHSLASTVKDLVPIIYIIFLLAPIIIAGISLHIIGIDGDARKK